MDSNNEAKHRLPKPRNERLNTHVFSCSKLDNNDKYGSFKKIITKKLQTDDI